jgi:acyl-CoA synthetase (AMP-forming)/AMP-acid ligase II
MRHGLRPRARPDLWLSGRDRYIVGNSARHLPVDPVAECAAAVTCKRRAVLGVESDALLSCEDAEPQPWHADENATATINYTSGTTARPKGVQLTHRNLWINAMTFALHNGVTDRDVYLHTLPTFHCNGWGIPFAAAGLGVPQIVLRKVSGAEILRRVDAHGVTFLCGAPAVVNGVLDAARSWPGPVPGRGRVRVIVAGAPPPTRTIERVETELGWEFIQLYGLTETSPLLTTNRCRSEWDALSPTDRARKLGRAGSPAIGVDVCVDAMGKCWRAATSLDTYWRQPRHAGRHRRRLVSHRRRRLTDDRAT